MIAIENVRRSAWNVQPKRDGKGENVGEMVTIPPGTRKGGIVTPGRLEFASREAAKHVLATLGKAINGPHLRLVGVA